MRRWKRQRQAEIWKDEVEDWRRVRTAIEHENQLMNHRMKWLLASQAFLFALMSLMSKSIASEGQEWTEYAIFYKLLCCFGILISIYFVTGLRSSEAQHESLRKWWEERPKQNADKHPPICGHFPNLGSRYVPYSNLSLAFAFLWICLLYIFSILN